MSMHETSDAPPPSDQRDTEWFYTQRGETFGPVSSAELRAAAHLGFVGPDDMVLRKGRSRWISARHIPGLFTTQR